jgi:hypothetical protein
MKVGSCAEAGRARTVNQLTGFYGVAYVEFGALCPVVVGGKQIAFVFDDDSVAATFG